MEFFGATFLVVFLAVFFCIVCIVFMVLSFFRTYQSPKVKWMPRSRITKTHKKIRHGTLEIVKKDASEFLQKIRHEPLEILRKDATGFLVLLSFGFFPKIL